MPQSACVMFEPYHTALPVVGSAVSMPQSACVMFEQNDANSSPSHVKSFNASIGVCDVRAALGCIGLCIAPTVSMPQSACVMFEHRPDRRLSRAGHVSMPQSACVMFERQSPDAPAAARSAGFNASIGVCDVRARHVRMVADRQCEFQCLNRRV